MNRQGLLSLYDLDRRNIILPGMIREETSHVVRHLTPDGGSLILWSALADGTADDVIRRQIARSEQTGSDLCWVVYAHDSPPDLKERLLAHGFEADEPETTLALSIDEAPGTLLGLVEHDVRHVTSRSGVFDAVAIRQQIWPGGDAATAAHALLERITEQPETLALFVAYVDGVPASTAQISFYENGHFASLVRAGTLPEYRGRGLYTGLIAARTQEARRRGTRLLDTDASPMSRPILEKLGFLPLTESTSCDYSAHR